MAKASWERRRKKQSDQDREAAGSPPATVASLGVQARLVPVDPEHEVACLIARHQRLCCEWDRLAQQSIALLGPEVRPDPSREPSSARKRVG
jgi:hypothetical protein